MTDQQNPGMEPMPATQAQPEQAGNVVMADPRMNQIRDFIDDSETPATNPLQLAARAFRGRKILVSLLALLLAVLFGTAAYMAVSPKYKSQGLIRVAARIPKVMYADPNDPRLRLFDAFVSAEVTYLQSRPVLERALQALARDMAAEDGDSMDISDIAQGISVRKEKGLISLSGISSNPEQASRIVNAVLEAYTELHSEASSQAQSIRERQLRNREVELLARLTDINEQILVVGEEHGTTSIAKAHLNKVTQLEDIDNRIDELETAIAQEEAQETSTEFDTGDDEIKRVTVLDKAMADMTYDRAKRAAALESNRLRYSSDHPNVLALETEIAVIDDAIEARRQQIVTLGKTGALTAGKGDGEDKESLAGLNALKTKLADRRGEIGESAKQLNSKLIQLTFLKEEHGEVRKMLDETRRTLEEVRVESRNALPGSVEVIAHGAAPKKPFEDKRKKLAVAGGGFGMFSALGLVMAFSFARPRIRYSDDLAALVGDDAMLGVLPEEQGESGYYRSLVHQMRNQLLIAGEPNRGALICVGSTGEDGESATVARALAESFGVSGVDTLLIDGDLIERGLTRNLGMEGVAGLSESLSTNSDRPCELAKIGHNLSALPAGLDSSIGGENLALNDVRTLLRDQSAMFDFVIIDTGHTNTNIGASLLASLSDYMLIVVPAGERPADVVRLSRNLRRYGSTNPLYVLDSASANDPDLIHT